MGTSLRIGGLILRRVSTNLKGLMGRNVEKYDTSPQNCIKFVLICLIISGLLFQFLRGVFPLG
ncbi:hypothetical protein HQ48_05110 [Porphyromonas sp. COT-290 OH3588]|nr:hypothetical protein HQ48_05110 [Porphyromonas sp. COT-290 OH3588]